MLIAIDTQVPGFVVHEGEALAATLIAVDLQEDEPMVTLARIGGLVTTFASDVFYIDPEDAERDAQEQSRELGTAPGRARRFLESEGESTDGICNSCVIERARAVKLTDGDGLEGND